MRRFYLPTKDASIYEQYPTRQSGLDEILEIGKTNEGINSVRSLIYFDISNISSSMANGVLPISSEFDIEFTIAHAEKILRGQTIYLYPVSESWEEGAGYFYQDRIEETNGVTWKQKTPGISWQSSGSTYISSSVFSSASFVDIKTAVTASVTDIIRTWVSGTIVNNGLVILFDSSSENDTQNDGIIKFFSKDTHTIYSPVLTAKFDNSVYSTGSYTSSLNDDEIYISARTLQTKYSQFETPRVYLTVRPKYPLKTFGTILDMYAGKYYLPSASYFSVVDVKSNLDIIPFDEYSKINISGSDSYIEFSTERMYPLRYYQLVYKIIRNGRTEIYKDDQLFSIRQK